MSKISKDHDAGLYFIFRDRLEAIVRDSNGVGWGFHDGLADIFYTYAVDLGEELEED
ncbi:hypothetical protein D3C71_2139360 [compost metagenome]